MRAIFPVHLTILDLIILRILVEEQTLLTSFYRFFPMSQSTAHSESKNNN
jgi:hypothetical protein